MNDDLEALRAALKSSAPDPDPKAKAATLRRAMENFGRHQGSANPTRPMSDRPEPAGLLTGVRKMISQLSPRAALAATACVAALGIGVMIYPALVHELTPPRPEPATIVSPVAPEGRAGKDGIARDQAAANAPGADQNLDQGEDAPAENGAAVSESSPNAPVQKPAVALAEAPAAVEALPMSPALESAPTRSRKQASGISGLIAKGIVGDMLAQPRAQNAPLGIMVQPGADTFAPPPEPDTETYANADQNPVKIVTEDPVSTFSIDTDTASYAIVRSSLANGYLPPADAIRVEEMINYFPYDYAAPDAQEAPFRASISLFATPWNANTRLLRIGLQGALPAPAERAPLNLVFLIDTSGSMQNANKLPLLKQSLRLLLGELRPEDRVAIVTYAGSAGLALEPTAAAERATILGALDRLDAGGSTAGQEGLQQAYQVARSMARDGDVSRILLATDGDFNVGMSDPESLKGFVARERDSGIYLSVLGFGRGNLDDATMQALAQNGNGTAAYIDTLSEAQKVLVDQLSGALFPIADDVKIQIEFNPAAVAEYRLIGYETRALAREDFNNDKVDAGEIGAGHQVTALYEVTPVGSPARLSDPLRYGKASTPTGDASELGFLKLRYKAPGAGTSTLIETPIPPGVQEPDADARFAAAIAGMAQLLRDPKYLGDWGWDEAIALANGARGADPYGYRAEAVQLMRLAESLSR